MKIKNFTLIFILIFICNIACGQSKKSDTLFIFTDFSKENGYIFENIFNIKIELREESAKKVKFPGDLYASTHKIPSIKIVPKNIILKELLEKKELNNFSIGIQRNICFKDYRVKKRDKCDINNGIYFIHKDLDYQFLDDYYAYLRVVDSLAIDQDKIPDGYKNHPIEVPKNTYGQKIVQLDKLKSSYDYSNLSEFTKNTYFFNVAGIVHLVKKYKVIYIENKRIDENTVLFDKVDYQYYSDDSWP